MKKNFSATLLFGLFFIALIAWYQLYEKKYRITETQNEEKSKQLVQINRDDIQELTIERMKNMPADDAPESAKNKKPAQYETIILKKTGTDWNLVQPLQELADDLAIAGLLNTLTTTKQDRVVDENPKDLSIYGLEQPLIKISAKKDSNDKGTVVYVGKNTPVNFNGYAQVGGNAAVYRVPRSLRSAFEKPVKDLRNKKVLVGVTRTDVVEAEVQLSNENIVVKREAPEKDSWILARDLIPADNSEWNKTLNAVIELKAKDFGEPGKDYGFARPAARVLLTKKDNTKVSVSLSVAKDKIYARRDGQPQVYEVEKEIMAKVLRPSEKLRATQIAHFNRFDTKRIKMELAKGGFELVKEEANWSIPGTSDKIDTAKVDTLLSALQDIKVEKYLPTHKAKGKPELTIRLFEKKEKEETEKLVLSFAKLDKSLVRVERSGLVVPFAIKAADFQKLNLAPTQFVVEPEKKEPEQKNDKKS